MQRAMQRVMCSMSTFILLLNGPPNERYGPQGQPACGGGTPSQLRSVKRWNSGLGACYDTWKDTGDWDGHTLGD